MSTCNLVGEVRAKLCNQDVVWQSIVWCLLFQSVACGEREWRRTCRSTTENSYYAFGIRITHSVWCTKYMHYTTRAWVEGVRNLSAYTEIEQYVNPIRLKFHSCIDCSSFFHNWYLKHIQIMWVVQHINFHFEANPYCEFFINLIPRVTHFVRIK